MKQAMRKLLAMVLVATMIFSIAAPGMSVSATPAGDPRVTEVQLPDQDWQMDRKFPKGTDDTLAINSIHSFDGYRDQGEIYVTLDSRVTSFRLFVNNVEIGTGDMVGGKTYVVDIADIAVDGTNSVQVSNISPVGINGLVTVKAGYPSVIEGIPEDVGMDSSTLEALGDMLENEVKYGFSGVQVAIVKDGKLVYNEAFGSVNGWNADGTQIKEGDENYVPVTTETLFDLASNSKMYTANYAVQYLYEQGKLNLDTTIESLFPGFVDTTVWIGNGYTSAKDLDEVKEWKAQLTIKDILMHQAGFAPDPLYHNNYFDQTTRTLTDNPEANVLFSQDRDETLKAIMKTPLQYKPGAKTVYSDVDYMLLCFIVEKITGKRFDTYLKETFWDPMGLEHMTFNPLDNGWTVDDCAATELDGNKRADFEDLASGSGTGSVYFDNIRDGVCQGTVHDEKCYYAMGGISGHAGLYSNAEDLAKLCTVMLTGGYGSNHYFKDSTIEMFTEAKAINASTWGLGWWREGELGRYSYWTSQSSNDTIGHQGWTGTLTMIDPEEDLVTVILGNRKNSPVLANEKGENDFFGDNMVMGSIGICNEYVYEALRSTPDAVDASIYEMASHRIRALSSHKGAYDEVAHMNDAFALVDTAIVRAEKRQTLETVGYAKELVANLRTEVGKYVTSAYGVGNKDNNANAEKWLAEFDARIADIVVTDWTAYPVMHAERVEDAPGINPNTLAFAGGEAADQNAVYFPRVGSSSSNATGYTHRNHVTWWDTFEGQGKMYVSVYKPVSGLRIFLNGHEVDTSNMINTTGIFEIDASEYTRNGRNLIQMTDVGYNVGRSILLVVHNAEVIEGDAAEVGIDEAVFDLVDTIVANDVEHGFTSAQLAVVKDGKLVHTNAWGAANSYHSDGTRINEGDEDYVAVTDDTLYDLASNSKMYSVNYALQKLVSDGKVSLTTKIVDLFPTFADSTIYKSGTSEEMKAQIVEWKKALTIRDILEHQAGFDADPQYHNNNFDGSGNYPLFSQDRETTLDMVLASPLTYEPGTKTVYSDVDYMLLCFVIEQVTGMGIDEYLKETFWDPMGLTHVTYNPLDNGFTKEQTAATELNGNTRDGVIDFVNMREGVIQGTVHDEKCYYSMDGISGHAGLFANATTLATLAQVMQNYNGYGTTRLANAEVNTFFTDRKDSAANWGLGWWREGDYQRPWYFGAQSPSGTVGHQGWTGTLSSIDTENNLTTAYLTNKINSPVTDNKSNANKFDGNWYTASSLGFVPTILYMGMEEFNAADDIQPALDALLIDMAVIKMNRVVGNGTVDINHPNLLSAYAIMEAAVEAVAERPTEENIDSLKIAFTSMARKYTYAEMADLYAMVAEYIHYMVPVAAKAPTCTEDGNHAYYHCPACDTYFKDAEGTVVTTVEDETLPALGHAMTYVEAKEATCTEDGNNAYYYCETCGVYFKDAEGNEATTLEAETLPALGHSMTYVEAKEVTCTEDGCHAHYYCATCGGYFNDAEGLEPTTVEEVTIKSPGHAFETVVTAPTCTKHGYTTYTCTVCDEERIADIVAPLGHSYSEWTVTKAPTCTEAGVEERVCAHCGHTESRPVEALGHKYETVVTEPTCTEGGYTTHTCSVCGDSYVTDEVAALGHDFGEWTLGKAPTCTEEGYETRVCATCGEVETNILPAECASSIYVDVKVGSWYHDAVDYMTENGYMNGMDETHFAPTVTTTRAMMAQLLYRMAGEPSVEGLESPFVDVKAGQWHHDAIVWAANEGIVNGISANVFAPNTKINRMDMVVMLHRYAGKPEANVEVLKDYTDNAEVKTYAKAAFAWAIENGIVTGMSEKTLEPMGLSNRAQIAVMLSRYLQK